jgi:hypothetical protein
MNDERETKWKEKFLAHFEVLSKDSSGEPEENQENVKIIGVPSGFEEGTSLTQVTSVTPEPICAIAFELQTQREFISVVIKCKLHINTNQPIRELISQVTA